MTQVVGAVLVSENEMATEPAEAEVCARAIVSCELMQRPPLTVVEVAAVVEVVDEVVVDAADVEVVLAEWCEGCVVLVVLVVFDVEAVPHAARTSPKIPTRDGPRRNCIPDPPCGPFGT
jgi:hypothetical protein